jgi:N,N'-diacetylbacillosaminyl-diphospho-undecaprenol alpha-1,3-N-acetylgalactosaminyltransferase
MRIAFVGPDDLSLLLFCKRLIKTLKGQGGHRIYTMAPITFYQQEIDALGVCHLPINMERFISPLQDLRFMKELHDAFTGHSIEAVINFTTKPLIYGGMAAWWARVPRIIGAVRGLGSVFLPARDLKSLALRRLVEGLYMVATRCSSRIWFTNRDDMAYFLERGFVRPDKVFLTTNSVNLEDFSPAALDPARLAALREELGLTPEDLVVIMVARMVWSKGVTEYVDAAQMLGERFPRVKFLLVGPVEEGSLNCVPPAYLKDSEQQANLKWLGFRKDVRELYALAAVAVLPSYYKEGGYPRALLEPMAMGKPVITTDTDGCRGPVEAGRNGLLVLPRDAAALAEVLAMLLEDANLRGKMGLYARQKMEREFDDQVVIQKILAELLTPAEDPAGGWLAAAASPGTVARVNKI